MTTQDAVRIADLETAEARNRRGWTPDEIRRALPVGQTPAFKSKWQALMRQLETVLSLAHMREPNPTQTAEAVSIAKHHLAGIGELLERKTP
jgi:hypothetical protein